MKGPRIVSLAVVLILSRSEEVVYRLPTDARGFATKRFDFIVVGGGGAGCVVARTLADVGHEVLLIERGDQPRNGSLTLRGLRDVLLDSSQTQPVLTTNGVRSHLGAVLGGGSSVNIGIWIEENWDYFRKLNSDVAEAWGTDQWGGQPAFLSQSEVEDAYGWLRTRLGQNGPENSPPSQENEFLQTYQRSLKEAVEKAYGPTVKDKTDTAQLETNSTWSSWRVFSGENGTRSSTAELLKKGPPNLTILLKSIALSLDMARDEATGDTRATCVVFRQSKKTDMQTTGVLGKDAAGAEPVKNPFLLRSRLNVENNRRLDVDSAADYVFGRPDSGQPAASDDFPYRVCLDAKNPEGEIILAAGALGSPLLLFQSGIGPTSEVESLGSVPLVLHHAEIGRNLQDRPLIGFSLFLKRPYSHIDSQICQVTALKRRNVVGTGDPFDDPCSPFEEIAGGTAQHGVLVSSRLLFPPDRRNDLFGDLATRVMEDCFSSETPRRTEPICAVMDPLRPCFDHSVALWTFLSRIRSRGSIKLRASRKKTQDHVTAEFDLNYLDHPQDMADLRENLRVLIKMVLDARNDFQDLLISHEEDQCPLRRFDTDSHSALSLSASYAKKFNLRPPSIVAALKNSSLPFASAPQFLPKLDDTHEIDQFIRDHYASMWHLIGSVQLGKVLDSDFRIPGISGLSVVDASAVPLMPRMNPCPTILAIARVAALRKGLRS